MNEYNVGDLVEASKGHAKIIDRIAGEGNYFVFPAFGLSLQYYTNHGYTLTVIEKAAPPLPTEPGVYQTGEDGVIVLLADTEDGERYWRTGAGNFLPDADAECFAPFTRLEPVAETAREVLRDVAKFAWADGFGPQLNDIARKYGVGE